MTLDTEPNMVVSSGNLGTETMENLATTLDYVQTKMSVVSKINFASYKKRQTCGVTTCNIHAEEKLTNNKNNAE